MAEDAAAKAVTVDADGNLNVEKPPLVGKAAGVFDRAVRVSAAAKADALMDQDLIRMRDQFRTDPDAFLAAANEYKTQKIAQYGEAAGPQVGEILSRQADQRITQTFSGLLNENQHLQVKRAGEAVNARIETLGDDMESLARKNGIGPEFAQRFADVKTLIDEKVKNPLFAYPQEKADAFLDSLTTRVNGAAILESTERVYNAQGFEAARDHLRGAVKDLDGKVKSLDKIEGAGMKFLRSEEAGMRGDRMLSSQEWSAARPQAATLPRETLYDMRDRAAAVGNHRVASDIDAHIASLNYLSDFRALPPGDRASVAVTGVLPVNMKPQQREVQGLIETEARAQGVDPQLAAAVGWRESKFDPTAAAATSTARGPFQLTEANRQRAGLGPNATTQDEVRAGVANLKETIGTLRDSLGREPTPAEVYIGHFQGAGAATAIIRADPNADLKTVLDAARPDFRGKAGETWGDTVLKANPFLKQYPTVGSFKQWAGRAMGDENGLDLTQTRGGLLALQTMKRDMAKDLATEITSLKTTVGKEEFPPLDQAMALGEKVYAIGTPDQQREVSELVAISKVGQQFMTLPKAQREQMISEADADLKSGAPRFDARLRDALKKTDSDITTAFKTDPYGAFYRYSKTEAARPTPAIDFADPSVTSDIMGLRVKQQSVMRAEQGIGPASILRPGEQEAFRSTLAQGDAKATAGALATLNQLPDDILAATTSNDVVKAGIIGATRSPDQGKFNAVMSTLDNWYARDPVAFKARFGDEAWNTLKSWQSTLRYVDGKTLAEDRTKAIDPQLAEQRAVNMKEGQKFAREHSIDDVVKGFDTSWGITPGFIARATGSQPLPPVDRDTRDQLMGDYETLYERRYAETRDKDTAHAQAIEGLKTKWARSDVNGGRLMLRAPELVYPAVNDSHDWMKAQIEHDLTQVLGPKDAGPTNTLSGDYQELRSWEYTIVSDRKTEEKAQRYDRALPVSETNLSPSYLVMVKDNRKQTPQWDVLRAGNGEPYRMSFDPTIDQEKARADFTDRAAAMKEMLPGFDMGAATPTANQPPPPAPAAPSAAPPAKAAAADQSGAASFDESGFANATKPEASGASSVDEAGFRDVGKAAQEHQGAASFDEAGFSAMAAKGKVEDHSGAASVDEAGFRDVGKSESGAASFDEAGFTGKVQISPKGRFAVEGLPIKDGIKPGATYGKEATANAQPFSAIVVHYTGTDRLSSALNTLRGDPFRGGDSFGYHFYIDTDGTVTQAAPLEARTNHVQPPTSPNRTGRPDISNSNAVGISFVGKANNPTAAQLESGSKLAAGLMRSLDIPIENIVGHGEVQNSRKKDEGMALVDAIRATKAKIASR
jgi:hypothetical protein